MMRYALAVVDAAGKIKALGPFLSRRTGRPIEAKAHDNPALVTSALGHGLFHAVHVVGKKLAKASRRKPK